MSNPENVEIPCEAQPSEEEVEMFGRFTHLCPVWLDGVAHYVPAQNTVLRGLQYISLRTDAFTVPWSRLCWNNTSGCCEISYRLPERSRPTESEPSCTSRTHRGRACVLRVVPGLEILTLPKGSGGNP